MIGVLKEVGNELLELAPPNQSISVLFGPTFSASNDTQATAMTATGIAVMFIPGGGEEKAAATVEAKVERAALNAISKEATIQKLTAEAEKLYPKLAAKFQEHHIDPKYLGRDPKGPTSKIPAAYHQLITNEFRKLAPYGEKITQALSEIKNAGYSKLPLP